MTAVAALPFTVRYPLFMRAVLVSAWVLGSAIGVTAVRIAFYHGGSDAHAYWLAVQGPLAYTRLPMRFDAYLYSPLFADVLRPFAALPWPVFWAGWTVLLGAVLAWLVAPAGWWAVPMWLSCSFELVNGNVYVLFAAVVVLGFRYPACWVFPILTKVVSGVGLVWFAARGEWRRLAVGVGSLALLVAVSFAVQAPEWVAWIRFLTHSSGSSRDGLVGLLARAVIGVLLVVVAARTDRRWLVPVAMCVVNPVYGITTATILAAVPRLNQKNGKNWPVAYGLTGTVPGNPDARVLSAARRSKEWVAPLFTPDDPRPQKIPTGDEVPALTDAPES